MANANSKEVFNQYIEGGLDGVTEMHAPVIIFRDRSSIGIMSKWRVRWRRPKVVAVVVKTIGARAR